MRFPGIAHRYPNKERLRDTQRLSKQGSKISNEMLTDTSREEESVQSPASRCILTARIQ